MIVTLSATAEADLIEIATWIARDNPGRALTFIRELRGVCDDLADFPRAYAAAPELGRNARRRVYGNYVIFYDVTDIVEVLTILHGARDIDRLSV